MNHSHLVIILLSLVVLQSCSVKSTAFSRMKKNFDFSKVNSYSTFERDSNFTDFQNISDATRNSIELAIEQAFDQQGLQFKRQSDADVVIGYHLISDNFKELKAYNKGVKYCKLCLKWSGGEQSTPEWLLLPGSLIIDVVEPQHNRSVWRSVLPLKFSSKDNSYEQQVKIRSALNAMLKQFPRAKILTAVQQPTTTRSELPRLAVYN